MNAHAKFAGNNITTSKYSVLTYLPRSLVSPRAGGSGALPKIFVLHPHAYGFMPGRQSGTCFSVSVVAV